MLDVPLENGADEDEAPSLERGTVPVENAVPEETNLLVVLFKWDTEELDTTSVERGTVPVERPVPAE